ncbi:thioredoxin-like fold domain-containing protein MRL7, chloroplastic [Andrographis paniculata]|uniref:thioredoxin-like fold domain-containing protein MRL7, chloroplastic n=1 Tax=Andrographis paniculata TaxID=175694 RepID=UPI0021E719B4|nr:thioredoxin-like fold domain-containing protein MRL7, chloroplastic [Andrographis paniculata]XP_051118593.1 thioredoxin-like fold domain-containing protein MRL7, chloroplastic [Andrographis paniculata]
MLLSSTSMSSIALHSFLHLSPRKATPQTSFLCAIDDAKFSLRLVGKSHSVLKGLTCFAESRKSDQNAETNRHQSKPARKSRKSKVSKSEVENTEGSFPKMLPKKPRRGRRSEAAAVEDYVRDKLKQTFESIQKQNPEIIKDMESIIKEGKFDGKASINDDTSEDDDSDDEEEVDSSGKRKMLVEEDDPDWPLDAEIGWGIRASEYFDQHPIQNVVGEDGAEIDWEGEIDEGLVKEINCLEWESFAFHPSPLIVLVFERYNRASHNWKVLKELEKAAEVFWKAKDRLPPRTVKIDRNIEKDLAYALKAKECPQILFLRGNRILYRETDVRTSDELVQMIAHFYYNAKKPSCINDAALTSPNRWR